MNDQTSTMAPAWGAPPTTPALPPPAQAHLPTSSASRREQLVEAHRTADEAIARLKTLALEAHKAVDGGRGRGSEIYAAAQRDRSLALRLLNQVGHSWADLGEFLGVKRQVAEKIAKRRTLREDLS